MANQDSSSTSCLNHGWTYDVFVSFHGKDTRRNFTGYLTDALDRKGIHIFRDDIRLKKGEGIPYALVKAIEESRIAVVVFSENYASSSWCLDELVEIMGCMKKKGQLVIPIFYFVDASVVRHQRESFGRSMEKHEERHGKKTVSKWRIALKEAANLSGWSFKNGYEYKFIQEITEKISSILNITSLHIADHPVGLNYRVSKVVRLLAPNSNDIKMVGIYGIGGIGKTTIARAVYNSISSRFEGSSFLADVRENTMKHGLVQLQETLLHNFLGENINLGDVNRGIPIIKRRLCTKKVLLILDDVDNLRQLRSLAGSHDWFGSGSRIIITTRDKHLLTAHGVENGNIYEVKQLNDHESLELFSLNAFRRKQPKENYVNIANRMVQYAKGLPLALNVIGSDLFGKTIEEWESALKKYERIPSREILDVLRVSYDNLDDNEKEIFLDIACFFKGNFRQDVEKTLVASRFFPEYGIGVLIDKSLVTISDANTIKMHDLIQDLGRDIARKDSPFDPGKRRRLWHCDDVLEVLTKNTGTDAIEGIMLDMTNLKQKVPLNSNTFENMKRLRILIVRNAQVSGAPNHLPNNLRLLDWDEYPLPSLPADFHPETLVVLNLPHSILTMDEPFKKFDHLTYMNFSGCDSLTTLPDVSGTPNLTRILANDCPNLVEIHDSVGHLSKLVTLSTERCPKLEGFPSGLRSKSLEYLNLRECSSIQSFPNVLEKVGNMKNIDIGGTAIKEFPNSVENFSSIEELILRSCKSFEVLPSNPTMFQNIEELNVEECPQLPKLLWKLLKDRIDSLPKLSRLTLKSCDLSDEDLELILSCFLQLKWLILSNNSFTTIPDCIEDLSSLLLLHVDNCNQLRDISVLPPDLQYINARNCMSLTSRSSDVILSQAFHEVEYLDIVVLRRQIPKWFDHCCKGGSADFWVRRKFPNIALFFLLGGQDEQRTDHMCEFHLFINDLLVLQGEREWPVDHVWLFDLQIHLTESERHNIREQIKSGWNHVKISCSVMNEPKDVIVKGCGIHLYKERMNIHDVSFISPDLHGSNSAYDNINDDLDFYDETSQDVVFPTVLAKFFPKNIAELLGNLHSGKRTGDDLSDYDEELELDSETDNQSMEVEEEQYSASINLQIPEICKISNHEKETDANSHKILMDPSRGTQEAFVSINEEELKHHKKGKFNKDGIGPESSMTASRRINNGTQVGDKINSGKEINGSSNPHVSENIGLHKSKQKSIILVEANAEAIDINENQVDIYHTHTHFPARIDNGQQSVPNAEAYTSIVESSVNEDNMETFYASLEAETDSESYPHGNQANIVSVITRPSEETKKELQFLRDLVTKKFSLLLHPGRSGLLKDKLKYLLTLPPEEGVSLRTNLLLSQLSTSFAQWSVDYNIASVKLESADKELLRAEKVREELKGNKEEYKGVKMVEDTLRDQLESLEEKKRELEVQINAIKTEIADLSAESNIAAKRKREVFEIAKILRSERDGLRNQVPRLKAEKEWAKVTQVNIEAEWSLLAEQVIGITTFEE
ncbi:hypothetical protein HN51_008265 [Arachis hypogaea]|uniref:TMV resistance protein N n=1 Tax=Arachis hypogaea TaxID=3818 RepID=UPI0034E7F05A